MAAFAPGGDGHRDLAESGLGQRLSRLIERHHRVPLQDGEEVATAVLADPEVCGIFGLPPGSPVVRSTCLLRDRDGRPVIYEEATWGFHTTRRSSGVAR